MHKMFFIGLLFSGLAYAQPGELRSVVAAEVPTIVKLYKDLHQRPELSMKEIQTSARLEKELTEAGLTVTSGLGGTGLVGVVKNGSGPVLLIRADMDGLPVQEETGLDYSSQTPGVMHACGHDVHMACLVGSARCLLRLKDRWHGTLVFVAQPGEEVAQGAKAMLSNGLYTRFPRPDIALALHDTNALPAGKVGLTEGFVLANCDSLDIRVRGVGGHGSAPQVCKDPILLASHIVVALQDIVSREVQTGKAAVLTVGSIHGGSKRNIIPNEVTLSLTIRSYEAEVRKTLLDSVARISKGQALAFGIPEPLLPQIIPVDESCSAVYNQPELCHQLQTVFEQQLGPSGVAKSPPIMASDDFGEFCQGTPGISGCFFWLGAADPERFAEAQRTGKILPGPHTSRWAPVPEKTIETGVLCMTAAVLKLAGDATGKH